MGLVSPENFLSRFLVLVSLPGCYPSRNFFAAELPSILLRNFWIFKIDWFTINFEITFSSLDQSTDKRSKFDLSAFVLLLMTATSSNFEKLLLLFLSTMLFETINEAIRISLADFICDLLELDHIVTFFHSGEVSICLSSLSFLSDFASFAIELDE